MTTTAPASTAAPLTVPRAVVRHGATVLVDVADLRLEPGRALTVVGESGSGKSVLAHALMGTLPPELAAEGVMTLGAERFDLAVRDGRRALWGRGLALLPQEPMRSLDPTMPVRHQVAEGAAGWRPRDRSALHAADAHLARLGLAHAGDAYPHTLSGGMAQRVAYAAATIGGARVLIVDEPSKGLDAPARDHLAALLRAHVDGGGLLLTITHDLRLARLLGGDVLVMRDASVVEQGPAEQVLDAPAHAYTRRLLGAEPARWQHPWVRATAAPGDPVVTGTGLTKAYGSQVLFEGLDLEVRAGERVALAGPSGVGKTTLGNALLRLVRLDAGTVTHAPAARGGRLQKLYQDPGASFPRRVPLGVDVRAVARRHGASDARVAALLDEVGISPDLLRRRPGQVSGGELQRVAVVRAMLTDPLLLLADEATSRLDAATQEVTTDVLLREVTARGCALLWVTHDDDLAAAVAHRRVDLRPV